MHDIAPAALPCQRRSDVASGLKVRAKENPGARPGSLMFRIARPQADPGFFANNPLRLSKSSIFTPWRFMMIACWMIDSVLFQAQ